MILICFPGSSMADRALDKTAARHLPVWPAREKPGAVARPGFQHTCKGYLFMPESRFIVKIFFPKFSFRAFCGGVSEHMSCRGVMREIVATFALPSVAMFIMVGWDVCLDPSAARHRSQHAV